MSGINGIKQGGGRLHGLQAWSVPTTEVSSAVSICQKRHQASLTPKWPQRPHKEIESGHQQVRTTCSSSTDNGFQNTNQGLLNRWKKLSGNNLKYLSQVHMVSDKGPTWDMVWVQGVVLWVPARMGVLARRKGSGSRALLCGSQPRGVPARKGSRPRTRALSGQEKRHSGSRKDNW